MSNFHREHYYQLDTNNKITANIRRLGHEIKLIPNGQAGQDRILITLKRKQRISQKDLTDYLNIKPGSMSEILAKIESKGLIKRSVNEDDHRSIDIELTDDGLLEANRAVKKRDEAYKEILSCLNEQEKEELLDMLERIYDKVMLRVDGR